MAELIPPLQELIEKAKEVFRKEFSAEATTIASAPGRVNLIGEHVDYCDGFVLPMVIIMLSASVNCNYSVRSEH